MHPMIDAHIHLDLYEPGEREQLLDALDDHGVKGLIAVSMHAESARELLELKKRASSHVFAAFGYHPEQVLPSREEMDRYFRWIREHREEMAAVGEVGLPYYTRMEAEASGEPFDQEPYVELLERFVQLAAELEKPLVLHAVHEDAHLACDLLEKHGVGRAHFHWFKGSPEALQRMRANGYCISVTPDVVYKERTRSLVEAYPIHLLMVETDGPWPFEGPYAGRRTHPAMMRDSIREIARVKGMTEEETGRILFENTCRFYRLTL